MAQASLDGIALRSTGCLRQPPAAKAVAGVRDFKDLAANADKFHSTIYGIEPGAPANQNVQQMIDAGEFGLVDWKLVESSEQAMLSQVDRKRRAGDWIVFLACEPHPMNTKFPLEYLSAGTLTSAPTTVPPPSTPSPVARRRADGRRRGGPAGGEAVVRSLTGGRLCGSLSRA